MVSHAISLIVVKYITLNFSVNRFFQRMNKISFRSGNYCRKFTELESLRKLSTGSIPVDLDLQKVSLAPSADRSWKGEADFSPARSGGSIPPAVLTASEWSVFCRQGMNLKWVSGFQTRLLFLCFYGNLAGTFFKNFFTCNHLRFCAFRKRADVTISLLS